MSIPYISAKTVRKALSMAELIPLIEKAMVNYSLSYGGDRGGGGGGGVVQPLRTVIPIKEHGAGMATMPVYSSADGVLATKLVTLFPSNQDAPTHQGTIVLMSATNGSVLSFMDAEVITEMRTAAASAVATNHLASSSSAAAPLKLGIIGSGVQAKSHVRALRHVRLFSEIRVWSPNRDRLQDFVDEFRASDAEGANGVVTACGSAEEAVADADVIVTATLAKTPVLFRRFVKPGALINAVGAPFPDQRELDEELAKTSRIFVDGRVGAEAEAGDIILNGAQDRVVAEIGEVAAMARRGSRTKFYPIWDHLMADGKYGRMDDTTTTTTTTTTIFKNLGMAIQDAVAAKLVYEKVIQHRGGK